MVDGLIGVDCPIAYDHDDDLGYCNVCGWTVEEETPPHQSPWAHLPQWLWPDHAFLPPDHPVTLCGGAALSHLHQEARPRVGATEASA
jgi:hypothetical protein